MIYTKTLKLCFLKVGEPRFTSASDHSELIQRVRQFREDELSWLTKLAHQINQDNDHL